MKFVLPVYALLAAALGSLLPFINLRGYWNLPVGTSIRPMEAPFQFLLFGCGTPVLVCGFVFATVYTSGPLRGHWLVRFAWWMSLAVACLLSFAPAILTTFGLHWVIAERQLWVKP